MNQLNAVNWNETNQTEDIQFIDWISFRQLVSFHWLIKAEITETNYEFLEWMQNEFHKWNSPKAKKDGCWMNQTEVWVNGVGLAKMNDQNNKLIIINNIKLLWKKEILLRN